MRAADGRTGGRVACAAAAMAVLVVGLGCSEGGMRPSAAMATADSADQVMLRMSTRVFDGSLLKSHVMADTAYVYQARQQMDLHHLTVTFYDDEGRESSVLTADRGLYTITTGSLDARGHVVVESNDGKRLTTPHLIYDKTARKLVSDSTFTYRAPTEQLRGRSFTSDLDFRNVIVDGPVGRQRGKGLLLPGQ